MTMVHYLIKTMINFSGIMSTEGSGFSLECSTCLYSIKLERDSLAEQNTQISAENHVIRYLTLQGVAKVAFMPA
jgi:hypothetical protein